MNYSYWNKFVDYWRNLPKSEYINTEQSSLYQDLMGWTNPNQPPLLMNSNKLIDYSLIYIPEPWWGNDGTCLLDSVVINYNPGGGGEIQEYKSANTLFGEENYQSFVNRECSGSSNHFRETSKWHRVKRAKRISNTLLRNNIPLIGKGNVENHLSIELIPWHTENAKDIIPYIDANLEAIFTNCIKFAADESLRIGNSKLKGKVIMRLSGKVTLDLLNKFTEAGICSYTILLPVGNTPSQNGGYLKFSLDLIPEVEFISIWGKRNDFPSNQDMDWIFSKVI